MGDSGQLQKAVGGAVGAFVPQPFLKAQTAVVFSRADDLHPSWLHFQSGSGSLHTGHGAFFIGNKETAALLELVGLPADFADRFPHELSGGQLQRVCIARAVACKPEVILFDEAISSLDAHTQVQVMDLLQDLKEKLGLTYVFITHDLTSITYLCDDVLFLYQGRVTEYLPVSRISETKDEYARRLLESIVVFDTETSEVAV